MLELFAIGLPLCAVMGIVGRYIAAEKGRPSTEGLLFGLLLGPFGVLIEALLPTVAAPTTKKRALRLNRSGWQPPKEDDPVESEVYDFLTERRPPTPKVG
jgi:hypothetical protein